jgi:hypothetical protein
MNSFELNSYMGTIVPELQASSVLRVLCRRKIGNKAPLVNANATFS